MVGQEKRKAPRLDCRVPIMCRRGSLFNNTQTLDISQGGVGLLSPKIIPINTNMVMEIALSAKSEPVLCVGKVCWVQKSNYSDHYRVGMNFTDIAQDSEGRLEQYLEKEIS
ncbi:MAG: PilZ domain-containing protein [Candidatus Omnitrophota bacterium]|nr:PilZ domain-containing protein [Candidatus Omnitrophota bacterium]